MQLFVTWIMEFFGSASRAITLGPWDLADRTERGLKISKILHTFAWLSFDFLFRDFGPSYLFHLFVVPIPYFLCGAVLGWEVFSPHLRTC